MKFLITVLLCFVFFCAYSQVVVTVAGNGTTGYTGDSGLAVNAELNQPIDLDLDSAGNIYFTDHAASVIRRIDAVTNIITTIAGNGFGSYNGDSIQATKAEIYIPVGLTLDKNGNIYFADQGNNRIRKIDIKSGIITTIAGNGISDTAGDGGLATNASLSSPVALAFNKTYTKLFIAEAGISGRIRKIDLSTNIISTIAPSNGSIFSAAYIVCDSADNVYVAYHTAIVKIDGITGKTSNIAGNGIQGYSGDNGLASNAELSAPWGIFFNSDNDFYISDWENNRIRKINHSDSIITTIAGNGNSTYNGENISALNAQFDATGIKPDANGNIYFTDIINHRIRKLTAAILPIHFLSFTAQKQNTSTLLQWQTADEVDNSYFDVERSGDSKLFTSIGSKQATNNAFRSNYSFVDEAPLNSLNYYRLKQMDKDGKFTYSNIVSVDFSSNAVVFAVYPNPTTNTLSITFPSINKTSGIVLYDANGREVLREQVPLNINTKQINISKLPAGVYNVVLVQDGKQQTVKVVKK